MKATVRCWLIWMLILFQLVCVYLIPVGVSVALLAMLGSRVKIWFGTNYPTAKVSAQKWHKKSFKSNVDRCNRLEPREWNQRLTRFMLCYLAAASALKIRERNAYFKTRKKHDVRSVNSVRQYCKSISSYMLETFTDSFLSSCPVGCHSHKFSDKSDRIWSNCSLLSIFKALSLIWKI